jgi:peptide methionine sulfoxide reductase MsrA
MSRENIVQVNTKKLQLATFAAGCFWGVEETFHEIKGCKINYSALYWRMV